MLTEKLEHVWSCLHTLSKSWENFMFSTISSIRNMSKHITYFTHLFVTNLMFIFMWVHLMKNQLKIWKKLWALTLDHPGDKEDSISFFIFLYLQWNMITTSFSSNMNVSLVHWNSLHPKKAIIPTFKKKTPNFLSENQKKTTYNLHHRKVGSVAVILSLRIGSNIHKSGAIIWTTLSHWPMAVSRCIVLCIFVDPL